MRNLLKPLLMLLAVPLLATAIGMLARSNWDSRWSATLVRQLTAQRMRPDDRLLARYSLGMLCSDQRTGPRFPPCRTYNFHSAVIGASAAVGAAGFAFLGVLLLCGHLGGSSRRRMARLFRPSLVFAASGTAVLAAANALLALGAVVAGASYLLGQPVERSPTSLVLVAGTAAVVWAIAVVAIAFSATRRPALTVVGERLDPAAQRPLVDEVRRVADWVGAEAPRNVVACLGSWVWVTESRVAALDGTVSGRTLCVSLPLSRILSIDEFRALLAHELAHFSKNEESFSRRVSPFHAGASQALDRLGGQARGIRGLAIAPPVALMSFFMDAMRGGAVAGDGRETEADRLAAAVTRADALGSALVKAHAFAPAWRAVVGAMLHAVASGTQYVNASALFQEIAASNNGPDRLRGIGRQELGHPIDRHPALASRLDALGLDLSRVALASLDATPPSPAIGLVRESEPLEQRLSAAEHRLMALTA
jgi:Zn-dependent protease with chaperone function